MSFSLTGNSLTISTTTNSANTTGIWYQLPTTIYTTDQYGRPYTEPQPYVPNATIPDAPETWLRRRVKEICDLGIAA